MIAPPPGYVVVRIFSLSQHCVPINTVLYMLPSISVTVETPQVKQVEVVIITSSVEGVQGALEIVQRSVAVPGTASPVTPDVGEVGVVMVAVPETTDHVPVPTVGVFPANVAVVTPHAGFISVPALAMVGRADTATEAVFTGAAEPQVLLAVKV